MPEFYNRSHFSGEKYEAVTPNDSTDLPHLTREVILSEGGALEVHDKSGATHVLPLPAGRHALVVARILNANTTATGITAVY